MPGHDFERVSCPFTKPLLQAYYSGGVHSEPGRSYFTPVLNSLSRYAQSDTPDQLTNIAQAHLPRSCAVNAYYITSGRQIYTSASWLNKKNLLRSFTPLCGKDNRLCNVLNHWASLLWFKQYRPHYKKTELTKNVGQGYKNSDSKLTEVQNIL